MVRSHTTMITSTLTQRPRPWEWRCCHSVNETQVQTSSQAKDELSVLTRLCRHGLQAWACYLPRGRHHAGDLRWWAVYLKRRDWSAERQQQKFVVKLNGASCTLIKCRQLWANVDRNINSINTTIYPCTCMGISPSALYNLQNIL